LKTHNAPLWVKFMIGGWECLLHYDPAAPI
jgi:hypothetical protein